MIKPEFSNEFMSKAVNELKLDQVRDVDKFFLEKKLGFVDVKSIEEARKEIYGLLLDPEYGFDDIDDSLEFYLSEILGEGFDRMYEKLIQKSDDIITGFKENGELDLFVEYYSFGESYKNQILVKLINIYKIDNNSSVEDISSALNKIGNDMLK